MNRVNPSPRGFGVRGERPRPRMRLILGDRTSARRANPHTLGSAPSACVLVCCQLTYRLLEGCARQRCPPRPARSLEPVHIAGVRAANRVKKGVGAAREEIPALPFAGCRLAPGLQRAPHFPELARGSKDMRAHLAMKYRRSGMGLEVSLYRIFLFPILYLYIAI